MEIAGPVVAPRRDLRRPRRRRCAAVPGTPGRLRPPVATATPTAPASTSPSRPGRRPTTARPPTSRSGTPAPAPSSRHGGVAQPPPRRRPATGPASCAEALGAGLRRARRGEGRARPERHPQPGQARPAVAVRRGRVAPRGRGREDGAVMELDPAALVRGVVVAAVICVPAALVGLWASDDDDIGLAGDLLRGAGAGRAGPRRGRGRAPPAGRLPPQPRDPGRRGALRDRAGHRAPAPRHQRRRDRVEPRAVERRPRAGGGRHRRRDRRPHGQRRRS